MPKQFFGKGSQTFKTIITQDFDGTETGHVSSLNTDGVLTLRAEKGTDVYSTDSKTVTISASTLWRDDNSQVSFAKELENMKEGGLAFKPGRGVNMMENGVIKKVSPGMDVTSSTFPKNAERGSLYISPAGRVFANLGKDGWTAFSTSSVSTDNPNIFNESGAHMTSVSDAGNYYSSNSNVEDILAEIAQQLPLYFTARPNTLNYQGVSGGHLTQKPDIYNWTNDNDSINELVDTAVPLNRLDKNKEVVIDHGLGDYYINRRNYGVKIGKVAWDDMLEHSNFASEFPEAKSLQVKYTNPNTKKTTVTELATTKGVEKYVKNVATHKLGANNTSPTENGDNWLQIYDPKQKRWMSPKDLNGEVVPFQDQATRLRLDLSSKMLVKPTGRVAYNIPKDDYNPNNSYDVDPYKPGLKLDEALYRQIMNQDFATNKAFNMDTGMKNPFHIFSTSRDASGNITVDSSSKARHTILRAYTAGGSNMLEMGEREKKVNIDIYANRMNVKGDAYFEDTIHVKDMEVTGKMTQNSDLFFHFHGTGKDSPTVDDDYNDKQVVKVYAISDDYQVNAGLRADSWNRSSQSQLYLGGGKFKDYKTLGRYGIGDDIHNNWLIVRETHADYKQDIDWVDEGLRGTDSAITTVDGGVGQLHLNSQGPVVMHSKKQTWSGDKNIAVADYGHSVLTIMNTGKDNAPGKIQLGTQKPCKSVWKNKDTNVNYLNSVKLGAKEGEYGTLPFNLVANGFRVEMMNKMPFYVDGGPILTGGDLIVGAGMYDKNGKKYFKALKGQHACIYMYDSYGNEEANDMNNRGRISYDAKNNRLNLVHQCIDSTAGAGDTPTIASTKSLGLAWDSGTKFNGYATWTMYQDKIGFESKDGKLILSASVGSPVKSTHSSKHNFGTIDKQTIFDRILATDIVTYEYKDEEDLSNVKERVGFVINDDNKSPYNLYEGFYYIEPQVGNRTEYKIDHVNVEGHILGAVKALIQENQELKARLDAIEAKLK